MNHRIVFSLTCAAAIFVATYLASDGSAQEGTVQPGPQPQAAQETQQTEADRILEESIERFVQVPSLRTDVRQEVNLFGRQFVGHGRYLQQGQGQSFRMSLELTLEVGRTRGTLLQRCDGQRLWSVTSIERIGSSAPMPPQVVWLNVNEARRALQAAGGPRAFGAELRQGMPLGGLVDLLYGIRAAWTFTDVEQRELDARPVYVLRGGWRPEALEALARQDTETGSLAPYIPDGCVLYLDVEHGIPLRVEFVRSGESAQQERRLVVIELADPQVGAQIELSDFLYTPPEGAQVVDGTEEYVQGLQQGMLQQQGPQGGPPSGEGSQE